MKNTYFDMQFLHKFQLLIFFMWILPVSANAEIRSTPAGYEWVEIEELRASFLKPVDWHQNYSQGKLMPSLVLHKAALPATEETGTRFSVNVVSNLTQTNYRLLSNQLEHFADNLSANYKYRVLSKQSIERGSYTGESIILELLDSASSGASNDVVEHRLYLANDFRDWLMIVSFQSAKQDWTNLQDVRDTLLNGFILD